MATTTSSLGNDAARTQLRNALAAHFHSLPSTTGYPRWDVPSHSRAFQIKKGGTHLLVGDPVTLVENIKILKQYSRLLSQACQFPTTARELSSSPATYPLNLQWFERLASPIQPLPPAATRRVLELLKLHGLCSPPAGPTPLYQRQEEAAFDLAKTLPHFDRDLTAFYLRDKCTREYELHVAHSLLRLSPHYRLTSLDDFMRPWLSAWRNQGLLHVLAVAAVGMPTLADWFPEPDQGLLTESSAVNEVTAGLVTLLDQLPTARSEATAATLIGSFIASQAPHVSCPTAQSIARTIDRLAILMRVKSNAGDNEADACLDACLDAFPPFETLEPADIWARIKPALERAIPPSILSLAADGHCKKKARVSASSW